MPRPLPRDVSGYDTTVRAVRHVRRSGRSTNSSTRRVPERRTVLTALSTFVAGCSGRWFCGRKRRGTHDDRAHPNARANTNTKRRPDIDPSDREADGRDHRHAADSRVVPARRRGRPGAYRKRDPTGGTSAVRREFASRTVVPRESCSSSWRGECVTASIQHNRSQLELYG